MKKIQILLILSFLLVFLSTPSRSQPHPEHDQGSLQRHRFSFMWANTLVPAGKNAHDEESDLLFPTWGLNYEFWLNRHMAIGWHNEFEMMSYIVDHGNEAVMEREYPYITSIVLIYEPLKNLAFHIGPGYEFETNESFFIVKMGAEYTFPLPKSFDLGFGFSYDNKNKIYDAWTFGLFIGKRLGKKE
ncbi:MAG: hypothetical protein KFF73_09895 [Cyclobacteriaceae bacterium]|nr:hypothetical protein [Cyclobacteriaceae bacterium]